MWAAYMPRITRLILTFFLLVAAADAAPQTAQAQSAYVSLDNTTWETGSSYDVRWNPNFGLFRSVGFVDVYLCHLITSPESCISMCANAPNFRGVCRYEVPSDFDVLDGDFFVLVTADNMTPTTALTTRSPGVGPAVTVVEDPESADDDDEDARDDREDDADDVAEDGTRIVYAASEDLVPRSTCISPTVFGIVSAGIVVVMGALWLISILFLQRQMRIWMAAAIAAASYSGGGPGKPDPNLAVAAGMATGKTSNSSGTNHGLGTHYPGPQLHQRHAGHSHGRGQRRYSSGGGGGGGNGNGTPPVAAPSRPHPRRSSGDRIEGASAPATSTSNSPPPGQPPILRSSMSRTRSSGSSSSIVVTEGETTMSGSYRRSMDSTIFV